MFTKIYGKIKEFIKENYKGILVLIIIYLVFTIELPYSIYTPGGAVNLNERIEVENGEEVKGSFNMSYVSMVKGSIPFVLISKIIPDWDLVKKEDITIEGEDMNDMMERERLYLQESINNATINAYNKANKKINITNTNSKVSYIAELAKTSLKIGDTIKSVDDTKISSLEDLKNIVSSKKAGEKLTLKIIRNNKETEAYATTYNTDDGIKIGVSIINIYDYDLDPEVKIKSKSSEMGSSGGLMMSLTIYNKLVKEDITNGKKIVGTGTIDVDGKVGEIGGVKYKLIGAVKNKADIFICPVENYEEAVKVAKEKDYDIKIISAKTFDEVLEKLKN